MDPVSLATLTHTGEIVNTNTFVLTCHGLTQSLTDGFICGMVAKDNLRGKNRFQLGLFVPGNRCFGVAMHYSLSAWLTEQCSKRPLHWEVLRGG